MEEVQLNVFVLGDSDNAFISDAIRNVGYKRTKEKSDADIIVCVMYCDEMPNDSNWLADTLKSFGQSISRSLSDKLSSHIPIVFLYTTNTGGNKGHGEITQGLANLGSELRVASLHVVENPINYESGQQKFEERLTALVPIILNNREEKQTLPRPTALVESEAEEQDERPPQPLPSVTTVETPKRKKVFIAASNDLTSANKQKIGSLITDNNYDVVEHQDDADVIVVACEVSKDSEKASQFLAAQSEELQHTQKEVIFTFVSDVCVSGDNKSALEEPKKISLGNAQQVCKTDIIPKLTDILKRREHLQQRSQVCSTMLNYTLGEMEFEEALTNPAQKNPVVSNLAPAPASVAQHASFFVYDYKPSVFHSRHTRKNYADKNLHIAVDEKDETVKMKKRVLLFVNYMSMRHTIFNIAHVNSTLSKGLEKELAKNLMSIHEYAKYEGTTDLGKKDSDYRERRRATVRGKKHDRVAKVLNKKLLKKYENIISPEFLKKLIDLASCADKLERKFFDYAAKQQDIQNILDAVATAYWNKIERPKGKNFKEIIGLPPDAQSKFNLLYNEAKGAAHRPMVQANN